MRNRLLRSAAVVAGSLLLTVVSLDYCNGDDAPSAQPDPRMTPYSDEPDHLWNRLHQALFVRTAPDGSRHIHATDPFLYSSGTKFLVEGEPHRQAVARLDEFLATPADQQIGEPHKRLFLQRDLWAAFDYFAWYPDEWVHLSQHEPGAIAIRARLATAIDRLALSNDELNALPDNYALGVESKQFATDHDPAHPEQVFLPPDLYAPAGPWVRFGISGREPITTKHFEASGGRAVHTVFLRLPGGRAATEDYLKKLPNKPVEQIPLGTMVAMVRRAFAIDQSGKIRVTPVTELVQMRVYRRIPDDPRANMHGDFGEQDVYEFVLDRGKFFAGEHGLTPTSDQAPHESFMRFFDPFERADRPEEARAATKPQSRRCINCHQHPGVSSISSMQVGLKKEHPYFRFDDPNGQKKLTVRAKAKQFNWGLLQGLLETRRGN